MATLPHYRLAANLSYLTLLFAVMLWVYVSLTRFDGFIRLEPGTTEHVAYLPAGSSGTPLLSRQGLPSELLPFDIESTSRHLDSERAYLPRALPFELLLAKETPEQAPLLRDELVALSNNQAFPLRASEVIQVHGVAMRVLGITPWQGLVASPRGGRCAALSLASQENTLGETLLIEADRWLLMDEQLAIGLHWHATAEEARAAASAQVRPGLDAAWWTVKDGEGAIRSTSFLPGAGTECADGSVWTVEGIAELGSPARPTLQVRVQDKTGQRIESIPANDRSASSRVRFHHPGAAATLIVLHAWREEEALYAKLEGNSTVPVTGLAGSEAITIVDGRRLWVTQVLPYALPLPERGAAVQQVVLEDDAGKRTYLREGGRAIIAENEYSYRREPVRESKPLQLEVIPPEPEARHAESVSPGEVLSVGEWRFSLLESAPVSRDPNGVYLRVRYQPFTPGRSIGLALFLLGSYGWVLIRFLPRRKAAKSDADTRREDEDFPVQ